MTDYFYDMDLVVDPLNPSNVVANGLVSIFDPADTAGTTLLALKDPSGLPLPNPVKSNANGFLPPRIATVPQTMWKSGGFTGYFNSYKGLRDEAVGAVTAAQSAANAASTAADQVVTTAAVDGSGNLKLTKANGSVVDAGPVKGAKGDKGDTGAKGLDGSNVLPTDDAIKQAINDTSSATRGALNATYARRRAYYVLDYMGNDDIGAAVNRAITAAAADADGFGRLGGQVIMPQGNFAQLTRILPKSGVDLIGQGWGRTVLRPQGGVTSIRRNREDDGATTLNYVRDVGFYNFEIDGSDQVDQGNGKLLKGFFMTYMYRARFQHLFVHHTGHTAIGNDFMTETIYDDCVATNAGRIGGRNGAGCSGLGFGTSGQWYQAPFPGVNEYSLKIINCVGRDNARFGMFFETQSAGDRQKGVEVINFSASGNGQAGLSDSGCDSLKVVNADLHNNTEAGFTVDAGTFPVAPTPGSWGRIISSDIRDNGTAGVIIDARTTTGGSGWVFSDTNVRNNGTNGMEVHVGASEMLRLRLSNMDITSNGQHGVLIDSTGGALSDMSMNGVNLISNGKSGAGYHGFRSTAPLSRPRFVNTTATDTATTKTQEYGFSFGAPVYGGIIDNNILIGNAANAGVATTLANYNLGVQGATNFDAQTVVGRNLGYNVANGNPETLITAPVGTKFTRKDGPSGKLEYIKTTGTSGSTGWVPSGSTESSGATANRPTTVEVGTRYFDTTLGKPVWVKSTGPTVWVDAAGTTV